MYTYIEIYIFLSQVWANNPEQMLVLTKITNKQKPEIGIYILKSDYLEKVKYNELI